MHKKESRTGLGAGLQFLCRLPASGAPEHSEDSPPEVAVGHFQHTGYQAALNAAGNLHTAQRAPYGGGKARIAQAKAKGPADGDARLLIIPVTHVDALFIQGILLLSVNFGGRNVLVPAGQFSARQPPGFDLP